MPVDSVGTIGVVASINVDAEATGGSMETEGRKPLSVSGEDSGKKRANGSHLPIISDSVKLGGVSVYIKEQDQLKP